MNPFEKIELKKDSFTKKEMIIYNILQKNPDLILRGSITSLSKEYQVSQSTITRFCQKIGYDGFNEFKFDVFRSEKQSYDNSENHVSVIESYCQLLHILEESLDYDLLRKVARDIVHAKTIIVTGTHKSSLPAQMLRYNLFKCNKKAIFLEYGEVQDLPHIVSKDDMVIMFSNQGSGLHSKNQFKEDKEKYHFNLTFVTMNDKLHVKKYCDNFVWLPSSSNQHFDCYLESQIIFFVYIDLLTSEITKL